MGSRRTALFVFSLVLLSLEGTQVLALPQIPRAQEAQVRLGSPSGSGNGISPTTSIVGKSRGGPHSLQPAAAAEKRLHGRFLHITDIVRISVLARWLEKPSCPIQGGLVHIPFPLPVVQNER